VEEICSYDVLRPQYRQVFQMIKENKTTPALGGEE